MRNRELVLYMGDTDGAGDVEVPFRWAICPTCDGHGTDRGASVECDGGGFTASEWAEQDEDFRNDYLAGVYDRACSHCEGGKVKVADESRMSPEEVEAWRAQCEDDWEYDAMCAAERRMGA